MKEEEGKVEEEEREELLLHLLLLLPLDKAARGGLRGCRFCGGKGTLASEVEELVEEPESFEEPREREKNEL